MYSSIIASRFSYEGVNFPIIFALKSGQCGPITHKFED